MEPNIGNIREKVKKLLNLANNSGATEAEAERAMEMASAMMLKYNINVDHDTGDGDEVKVGRGPIIQDFFDPWHQFLASAAAYLYMCKTIHYSKQGLSFVGRPENIQAAEDTFHFLIQQVEALYKINLPRGMTKSDRAEYRRTFKLSCASRVRQRAWDIVESFKKSDAKAIEYTGSRALVVIATIDKQLKECEEFMETLDLRKGRSVSYKLGSGSRDGRKAGDEVKLNRTLK